MCFSFCLGVGEIFAIEVGLKAAVEPPATAIGRGTGAALRGFVIIPAQSHLKIYSSQEEAAVEPPAAAIGRGHRRRIELEDQAKVFASDWRTESLLCLLFCLSLFKTNS